MSRSAAPVPGGPRHAATGRPGPRGRLARPLRLAAGGAVTLLALGAAGTLGLAAGGDEGTDCPGGRRSLDVAAAPEIAPLIIAALREQRDTPEPDAGCSEVVVTARPPADVAADLRSGSHPRPDAWVPDSSVWLPGLVDPARVAEARSLAVSPVLLALSPGAAGRIGDDGDPLAALTGGESPVRLALADPALSAPSAIVLADLARVVGPTPEGRAALARTVRAAERDVPVEPVAALSRAGGEAPVAVAVSEQALSRSTGRAAPPATWYPPSGSALDYPLVVVTPDSSRRGDLTTLTRALAGQRWAERLGASGFRDATGAPVPGARGDGGGTTRPVATRSPDAEAVREAVEVHRRLTLGMRMLTVLDVSGSMARPVPGLAGQTRMDVATSAAARGLALLPDDAEVGLWTFSTHLSGPVDHRELVPLGTLGIRPDGASGRAELVRELDEVTAVPRGETGLYDTVLAAVRSVRDGWDPHRVNSVVVISDGRDEDAVGIDLPELLSVLAAEAGDLPVPVIAIGYGPDGDEAALQEIARVTGGSAYVARDPRRIGQVLQDALALRVCRPDC